MRVVVGAIPLATVLALSLTTPSALAEATVNVLDLRRACMAPRGFAMVEMFGANYTPEQANILDGRLEQELSGKTPAALAETYQALERNEQSQNPHADRYAQCIYGERLRQLDPSADLQAVRRGEYAPASSTPAANGAWGAALTRNDRNVAAGSAVLTQSADPALRAARERDNAALRRQADERIAQRRAEIAQFWGAVMQAAVIAAETYIQVEAARVQVETGSADRGRAQTQTPPPAQEGAQSPGQPVGSPPPQRPPCAPPGTVYYYGSANCDPSAASQRTHNPANNGTDCVDVVRVQEYGTSRRYFVNGCGWPVEVVWDMNAQGRYTSSTTMPRGGRARVVAFTELPDPFPYFACKNRPEIGAAMYRTSTTQPMCIGPAA